MKTHPLKGKVVLVRDNMAGVFVGTLAAFDGPNKCATLRDARKVWQWGGALSVEDIAAAGLDRAQSKITSAVSLVECLNVVQLCACTTLGAESVLSAPRWMP